MGDKTQPFDVDANRFITAEVYYERLRQHEKWGQQDHPDFNPTLGNNAKDFIADLEIPTEERAKFICEDSFKKSQGSFSVILLEEFCEAIAAGRNVKELRKELIQVAAVAVGWIETIDRKHGKPS